MGTASAPRVPPAVAGPVTDQLLERAIEVARDAQHSALTDDNAAFLLLIAAPVMEECLAWRHRGARAAELLAPANVVLFRDARG